MHFSQRFKKCFLGVQVNSLFMKTHYKTSLFSAVLPRAYKRQSRQRSDAISLDAAELFRLPWPTRRSLQIQSNKLKLSYKTKHKKVKHRRRQQNKLKHQQCQRNKLSSSASKRSFFGGFVKLYFIRSLPRVSFWFSSISLPNLVCCLPYASRFSFSLSILFALHLAAFLRAVRAKFCWIYYSPCFLTFALVSYGLCELNFV